MAPIALVLGLFVFIIVATIWIQIVATIWITLLFSSKEAKKKMESTEEALNKVTADLKAELENKAILHEQNFKLQTTVTQLALENKDLM